MIWFENILHLRPYHYLPHHAIHRSPIFTLRIAYHFLIDHLEVDRFSNRFTFFGSDPTFLSRFQSVYFLIENLI